MRLSLIGASVRCIFRTGVLYLPFGIKRLEWNNMKLYNPVGFTATYDFF